MKKEDLANMKASEDQVSGWIDHHGSKLCPVEHPLQVRYRSGTIRLVTKPQALLWEHQDGPSDIMAYQVVHDNLTPAITPHLLPKNTSGVKGDAGKSPITQGVLWYFPRALQAVADQSKFGAEKYNLDYADKNFLRVEGGIQRYSDGLGRHILGEVVDKGGIDPESGMLHAQAAAWNALAKLEMLLIEQEEDKNG